MKPDARTTEGGQAVMETILLGLVLIVPLVWALGVLAEVHKGALATTAAVREAGSDAARSTSLRDGRRAIDEAVARALADQGLDPSLAEVTWSIDPYFRRGGIVEVQVAYPISVVGAPLIGSVSGPSVWVRASHITRIDPYRSRE